MKKVTAIPVLKNSDKFKSKTSKENHIDNANNNTINTLRNNN